MVSRKLITATTTWGRGCLRGGGAGWAGRAPPTHLGHPQGHLPLHPQDGRPGEREVTWAGVQPGPRGKGGSGKEASRQVPRPGLPACLPWGRAAAPRSQVACGGRLPLPGPVTGPSHARPAGPLRGPVTREGVLAGHWRPWGWKNRALHEAGGRGPSPHRGGRQGEGPASRWPRPGHGLSPQQVPRPLRDHLALPAPLAQSIAHRCPPPRPPTILQRLRGGRGLCGDPWLSNCSRSPRGAFRDTSVLPTARWPRLREPRGPQAELGTARQPGPHGGACTHQLMSGEDSLKV